MKQHQDKYKNKKELLNRDDHRELEVHHGDIRNMLTPAQAAQMQVIEPGVQISIGADVGYYPAGTSSQPDKAVIVWNKGSKTVDITTNQQTFGIVPQEALENLEQLHDLIDDDRVKEFVSSAIDVWR